MNKPASDAEKLIRAASGKGLKVVLAESCTAGLVSSLLAEVSGASEVLWGSYVTYTPDAKRAMIGLEREVLEKYGAVSRETALAMAEGALEASGADIAASVTGLAGPEGDGSGKPVGTVFIAGLCRAGGPAETREYHFTGSRNSIRLEAAGELIALLLGLAGVSG
ncbi:MAG: nicotinamide-nucleotide amidohydrolase family protein [Treponema sp.]|jgi:PncC family amidohydrolase|nr:nicotinamide-nucleotide amidohydrolase family protein [Treponema sp.]